MATLEERQRIGKLIHDTRKKEKVTQVQLGQLIGVTKKAISDYELAKVKTIPFDKRILLGTVLGIDISLLLYEQEKSKGNVNSEIITHIIYERYMNIKENTVAEKVNSNVQVLTDTLYDVFRFSAQEELARENVINICNDIFKKRGLSDADAVALANFFTWLAGTYIVEVGETNDIMQALKTAKDNSLSACQKENK
ncbi:helix-turn-helix domain-containing protein [Phascolarctobacterium succinatutens]|uniref:helix-turn-helix domain-containing protein n=1 Tax=Phascolarctobacterium succinatutens TaxID=626940 RepID=UPI0026DA7C85|nr:helix-turn-helix transcriptional regulator [Phascolarctobacterium succinatutens]